MSDFSRIKKISKKQYRYKTSAGTARRADELANNYRKKKKGNKARILWSRKRMRYEIFTRSGK